MRRGIRSSIGRYWRGVALLLCVLLAACGASERATNTTALPNTTTLPNGTQLQLQPGFRAELYAQGLQLPSALAWGPDGALYVAQLAGGENEGVGQIVRVAQAGAAPTVLLDKVSKPTGLAWRDHTLYIAAGRDVLRASLSSDGTLATPVPIVRNLPYNTRSEGQITALPDGRLVYEASGEVNDDRSGRLWTLDGNDQPLELAHGLKNAYAHAVDGKRNLLFSTEIGDDLMDGQAPPEEINVIQPGNDYGWPRCYGDQVPARFRGGNQAICAGTQPPLVTFPPHSTPTGLAFYDGNDFPAAYRGVLYVALFNASPPQVMRVTLHEAQGRLHGDAAPFVGGMERPIDLLPDPHGGLLILDHAKGTIYRITS